MKKIIAAALSVLLGAFGYTIVDKALEERVATLESGYVELRDAISEYHTQILDNTTDLISSSKTSSLTDDGTAPASVGTYLSRNTNSLHKFLLRKWDNSTIQFVSPNQFISSPTAHIYTRPYTVEHNEDYSLVLSTYRVESTDYYLYVSESSAQISDLIYEPSYKYWYDNDYSLISKPLNDKATTTVTVCISGYTDPIFSNHKITFAVDGVGQSLPTNIISNTINSDGSFEYKAIHISNSIITRGHSSYSLSSVSLKQY